MNEIQNPLELKFSLSNLRSLKRFSELRGTFDLRTGGRLQVVILQDALKQGEHTIEDATLTSLGIKLHMTRTTQKILTDADGKPAFSLSGQNDWQDSVECDVNNSETASAGGYGYPRSAKLEKAKMTTEGIPVVRIEITDTNGKPIKPIRSQFNYGGSITKSDAYFKDQLPDTAQLRLTVHRDSQIIRVPFALKNVPIPPIPPLAPLSK